MAILDTNLENALGVIESLKNEKIVFYGFNVDNNEPVLVQSAGSGYRTMEVVDSAFDSSVTECTAGDLIKREANKMSFVLPAFFRAVFIVAQLNINSSADPIYNRVMLEYGNNESKEIARAAQTAADHRGQQILIASYAGLAPGSDATSTNKLTIETYGSQSYFGANVVIGCII